MSDLFSTLSVAARALDAQRLGLEVAGQNIANVNTPGYARRRIDLASIAPTGPYSAGNGVQVLRVRAVRDILLERRLQQERPTEKREAAIADSLSVVEVGLGPLGNSLDARLTAFFDSFSQLSENPISASARAQVQSEAQSLTNTFHELSSNFSQARRNADNAIRSAVEQVNTLAARAAVLNGQLATTISSGSATAHLRDELEATIHQLSEYIDIDAIDRADGGVDVTFGNGRPLIVGATASPIGIQSIAPDGFASLLSGSATITTEITGGSIAGLLRVRDTLVPDYISRLDTIAYEVVQRVNPLHDAGFDQNGADAGVFFNALGGASGAAAAISVTAAIQADGKLIAAGATNSAGDNQTARNIAALRNTKVLSGGTATFHDAWSQLVDRVGRDTKTARDEQSSRAETVRQVEALRDSTSGVSLDEEAAMMMKFQRAYEANAKFFRVVDEALDTLLDMVG